MTKVIKKQLGNELRKRPKTYIFIMSVIMLTSLFLFTLFLFNYSEILRDISTVSTISLSDMFTINVSQLIAIVMMFTIFVISLFFLIYLLRFY